MTRITKYDADRFDPPAPVAHVTLYYNATGAVVSDVPMLLDTGADVTLLPREFVELLGVSPEEGLTYEVAGFDGAERPSLYGDFAAEFKAWDAASDEALENFEKGLK